MKHKIPRGKPFHILYTKIHTARTIFRGKQSENVIDLCFEVSRLCSKRQFLKQSILYCLVSWMKQRRLHQTELNNRADLTWSIMTSWALNWEVFNLCFLKLHVSPNVFPKFSLLRMIHEWCFVTFAFRENEANWPSSTRRGGRVVKAMDC